MSFTQPRAVFAEYPIMLYHINARRLRIRLPVVFDIFIQALSSKKAVSQQDGLHKAAALEVTGHTQSLADLECASRYRSHIRYTSYRPLRSPSNGRLPSSQAIDLSPDRRPEAHLSRAESLLDKLERSVVSCLLVISLRPDGIASNGEAVYAEVRRALLRKTAVYPKQASKLTRPGIAGRAACRRPDSSS